MAKGNGDTVLLQQCPAEQLAKQLPASASLPAPQALSSAAQLDQEVFAVLEVSTPAIMSSYIQSCRVLALSCLCPALS